MSVRQPPTSAVSVRRVRLTVRGVIQGVGFRPFVYNLATSWKLSGWVQNEADQVRIEIQGREPDVEAFCQALRRQPPPQAQIDSLEIAELPCQEHERAGFEIRASAGGASPRPTIPADLATCAECLQEIHAPAERRHRYPFTNCTNCGPRWSIIEQLPYDRPRTSMARFAMCPACQAEYDNPADRRFHAQPIACPACGPALELLDQGGRAIAPAQTALEQAAAAVLFGRVLALKGLGGFQLVVDATNEQAVSQLRQRKRRPDRPFALMFASLEHVRQQCEVSDEEAQILASHQAPIHLLRRRTEPHGAPGLAESVAPGNPYLGIMLPYTPLHHLLMEAVGRPIVCTSGNLSEEPMAITTDDALERLGQIADVFLVHDRPIVRPVDDSVARVTPEGLQILRRARGYAPLPIALRSEEPSENGDRHPISSESTNPRPQPPGATPRIRAASECPAILAMGGHLKNAVGLVVAGQAVISSHVGDLDSVLSVEVHRRAARDLVEFFRVQPAAVACDLHPDYASTRHGEELAAQWQVPLVRVQHHHAHVAACMVEHGLDGPVLGLSWDGTGYGVDGTIWGGEFLECEGAEFRRFAHLRTFLLPGGDRAAREPRRSALGLLFAMLGEEASRLASAWFTPAELNMLPAMLRRKVNSPTTSSMGRLFDAVAAICGLPPVISFEGQAAMALEFAADVEEEGAYPMPIGDGLPAVVDWEPMISEVLADRHAGVSVGKISARFHNGLGELALSVARRWGGRRVALTGGCFQNAALAARARRRLLEGGFEVATHHQVPPGDGGIALGQLNIAARRMEG